MKHATAVKQTTGLLYFVKNLDDYTKKYQQIRSNLGSNCDNAIEAKKYSIRTTKQSKNFVRN